MLCIQQEQTGSSLSRYTSGQVSELNFCVNIAKEIGKNGQRAVLTLRAHFVRPNRLRRFVELPTGPIESPCNSTTASHRQCGS